MTGAIFADPRLAAVYDTFDGDRSDLGPYLSLVHELGASTVLDVGCGTGTFACLLAEHGVQVIGVDPAVASLEIARGKPCANKVTWLHGGAESLPPLAEDLATMTANVAQVFLTDEDWAATLRAVRAALRPGGWLVFESRRPERELWREWTKDRTFVRADIPGIGAVQTWVEVTEVRPNLVSFRWTFIFDVDSSELTSDSTLRFRSREEFADSLSAAGFSVLDVREAPDRPGGELVFLAQRSD